jgi:hypothetical protein
MCGKFSLIPSKVQARLVGACLAALFASSASAHDFFIMPAKFKVERGAPLMVDVTIGSSFPGLTNPVPPERIAELRVVGGPQSVFEVEGPGSKSLKTHFKGDTPGLAILSARAVAREVEYPEERIAGIMEEYQVEPAAVKAVEALPRPRVLKALSTRFAKSFVCVERCDGGSDPMRPLGHSVEFIATDASAKSFTLLSKGAPLANYPVIIAKPDGVRSHLHTSAQGTIDLPGDVSGPMMLFAAVVKPPAEAGGRFTMDLASLTLVKN